MKRVLFKGGPLDGQELGISGDNVPSYLMMMPNPIEDSAMRWIVVGAGFDDHWPGQVRYEHAAFGLVTNASDEFELGTVIYRYAEDGP